MAAHLRLADLRHDLGCETLFSIAALDVPPGQFTVLTGPSGSGKTTLLHLLAGLLQPKAGSIRWDDADLARLPEAARDRWRRRRAGLVFQDFHLIPELSPVDNVLVPAWLGAFRAGRHRARAQELLARFGVPERARVAVLSRGEQQRVALARALLMQPAVIFADEPTASLDSASGATVGHVLLALARDEGRSVIAASHDPALIALADRRLHLMRGQPVEVA
ncbi:ABC transporter ATP-binding protein [Paracoccus shanxieyensis]|uniref:ATP-binding cassette domain-containing protein n=1 Tax=Paracoccus shanxieyensis TaxID=2675752 RepID=A0A6L6ISY6_9RHOB|nr:ATP-binding cassette domain-containing protein [Paracoccus shanxieyensis]MTH62718.1 ATP-binding cassette domain-containing protein [Paracoccus shanxieyensis]MTH86198.1 ATP-binding cassette domain-containing protein [Paracoccus shanxieyensis]